MRRRKLDVVACVALFVSLLIAAGGCSGANGDSGILESPDADGAVGDGSAGDGGDGGLSGFEAGESGSVCVPTTCLTLGVNCGAVSDGCGAFMDCGKCAGTEFCGAKTPNVCGSTCTPKTCADLSATCGSQGDGCGALIDCGTVPARVVSFCFFRQAASGLVASTRMILVSVALWIFHVRPLRLMLWFFMLV